MCRRTRGQGSEELLSGLLIIGQVEVPSRTSLALFIAEEMMKRGRMLREGSAVPMAVATGSSKRGPEDQGDRENARRTLPTQGFDQMEAAPIPLDLRRKKAEKRGPSDVEDLIVSHFNLVDMTDVVEVNHLVLGKLEMEERKAVQVTTDDYCAPSMPLTVIEESTEYSWVQNESTRLLSDMLNCTDVGPLMDRLSEKLVQSLGEEFIEPDAG